MRKSILTVILIVACYCISFAQQSRTGISIQENLILVEKIVDEKSDITGTFSNSGQWNVYVDDAKLSMKGEMVKEIKSSDIQDLLQAGFAYVKKTRSADICYRYSIAAATDGEHSMKLYECR